jgi:hypothetical protein
VSCGGVEGRDGIKWFSVGILIIGHYRVEVFKNAQEVGEILGRQKHLCMQELWHTYHLPE